MNNCCRKIVFASTLLLLLTSIMSAQMLEHLPYSGGVLVSRAIRAGRAPVRLGTGTGAMGTTSSPFSLTCSPAPCIYTPVDASEGGSAPVNEDPIIANPVNAKNLLTGGNDYNCSNIQGYFATTDGGATWSHFCSLGSGGEGDPIVGFDLTGKAYAGGIQNNNIVLASSTDGGKTFGTPVVVTAPLQPTNGLADKPWLEIDTNSTSPFKNALYVSSTQFGGASGSNSVIAVSHSTDGGLTWSTVPVDTLQIYPGNVDQFSDLAIGADGTVYANWIRCPTTGATGDCGGTLTKIMFSKSTDGGKTWSKAAVAATTTLTPDPASCCFYGSLPNTPERLSNVPANAALGSGATTKLYTTFYNWTGTQAQVEVAKSSDGGATWSAPVLVNPTSTKGDQFFQWLNVNKTKGAVAVTWLDRRNDPANVKYQPFFAYSSNSGASYSKGYPLSKTLSDPNNDGFGGGFMGDYTGNTWDGLSVYMSYMDTTTGVTQDFVTGVLF
jgi:Neuraminidase (sialidase)